MSDAAIQTIITIGLLVLGGYIAVSLSIKANKKQEAENQQIAKDLNWNFHHGSPNINIHNISPQASIGGNIWYYFDGVYKNLKFTIFSLIIPQGKYGQLNYLVSQIQTSSAKKYDFIVLGKLGNGLLERVEDALTYAVSLKEYKNVQLEGSEFNQNFLIYTKQADEAFYDLPPDKMVKLIEIKKTSMMSKIYIEVKPGTVLLCAEYGPFTDFVNRKNKITKEEIFSGFMDVAVNISNTLVG
jgi:hypothetical protein